MKYTRHLQHCFAKQTNKNKKEKGINKYDVINNIRIWISMKL